MPFLHQYCLFRNYSIYCRWSEFNIFDLAQEDNNMVSTRLGRGGSEQTTPSPNKRHHNSQAEDVLDQLLEDFSENNKDPEIIVPLCEKLKKYEHRLSGNSFVLIGSANAGKESHVLWLAKDILEEREGIQTHMITIDCRIYQSDSQFLGVLTRELRVFFGQSVISKHIIINETASINLQGLNKQFQKMKRKELILVIKSAEILATQRRKQIILYNIFQWLNNTDIKKYITFIILSRHITFLDKLEKRTRSRMNLPIIYLPTIKPVEVIQVITKRIEYRMERTTKKNVALLENLKDALENNKELMKVLDEQYEFCPRDITHYLKIMKLIITLDIQSVKALETFTEEQLRIILVEGFSHHSDFSADYKLMAKHLFVNLSIPEILLLGFLRQRLMNQEGRKSTEVTLKLLLHDYKTVLQRKTVFQAGSVCIYSDNVLEEGLIRLQDQNFLTVGKEKNLELMERVIVSQYTHDDLMWFFKEYCKQKEGGVPSFIMDLFHGSIYHE